MPGALRSRVPSLRIAGRASVLLCVFALLLFLRDAASGPPDAAATDGDVAGGVPALSALFSGVWDVALDGAGTLYIAEGDNTCAVHQVSGGLVNSVAGNGTCGYGGDGGAATSAMLNSPRGVAVDGGGSIYIADTYNCRVRKVSGGVITTVAGNGACGYGGDGGAATSASLNSPRGVIVDDAGDLYIADTKSCRVRKVSGGVISTFAGTGACGYGGDGGSAASALLAYPEAFAFDAAGKLYIVDGSCRIRKVHNGQISTWAGNGTCVYSGDGGLATSAGLHFPSGTAVDGGGNLYISEWGSCRVRVVSGNGFISTAAGTGACGFAGDGGAATSASLRHPAGLTLDSAGDPYIADFSNCRVRKLSGGTIDTVAGSGTCPDGIDSDGDGCTDIDESQTTMGTQAIGGRRDRTSFWDFYDVWTRPGPTYPWARDKVVTVTGDIFSVAQRFGATRPGGAPSKQEALSEALTPPASDLGYHTDYDRGPLVGPNVWNSGPPDGAITVVVDVLQVARQFGHSCL